ncbi:MAG: hypothetical protein JNL72_01145 [Flavipsychrobacter sp.]|nr:hypothetical protein [Flavipsychrobacter sp.]
MRAIIVLCALLLCPGPQGFGAGYTYDYNDHCRQAYESYMSLHLSDGKARIQEALRDNPNNLMAVYVSDYEDCLLLLLNGNKADYNLKKGNFDERLEQLNKGNDTDPWYRLSKAGVYLHWALVHLRFGDNMKAAFQFRKSFALLKENKSRFPNFDYNNIYLGLEQSVAGAIPDKFKWLASMFGIKGDVKKGSALITRFLNDHTYDDLFQYEAALYSVYLRLYFLYQQKEVWAFMNNNQQYPAQSNLLLSFVKANIALNTRKADVALQTLKGVQNDPYCNVFPMVQYELGSAYYYHADAQCIPYFQQFVARYKGNMFVKDAWQKMALMHYLQRNPKEAGNCRAKIAQQGNTIADVDMQAQRFSQSKEWPNYTLLYVHLLIDGGFHKMALDKLKQYKESDFPDAADKLEYNFRLARIYDEMDDDKTAVKLYQHTINTGKNRKEHFAARSALQMALIYERVGMKEEAIKRFKECLSIRDHDFQAAIDQQAKAGLNRLGAQ